MSKYVKDLISKELRARLDGVEDALIVNLVGLPANASNRLRKELSEKNIQVMVVKNSLAARAAAGTTLAPAFEGLAGSAAICWGAEDIVSLAKEITRLAKDKQYAPFEPRGGVMGGERLRAGQIEEVSKWPSRTEQLSLLVGQILGPGSRLAAQLLGPGGALAGQIASRAEEEESGEAAAETSGESAMQTADPGPAA
ncbi:MAG: 50S ribosomal protein L10 [Pirellulales bacterium]|nr:50S ribosomal protein L10 [Pirellulales bacterium]